MTKKLLKMKTITVMLPQVFLDKMDDLVREGLFPSRSDAIRSAIRSSYFVGELKMIPSHAIDRATTSTHHKPAL
jgi:Arc/MetJ-type ribon-helix-helix transcriptional regulator